MGDRFQRDVLRMLLVFFSVVIVDVVVVSLLTGKLRLWFPVWVDPGWATDPSSPVVYSQSYFAGIFFIPVLARIVDREFLAERAATAGRALFWAVSIGVLAFVAWWKGGLMVEHGKHWEAIAWLALSAILWGAVVLAESLPARVARMSRKTLLRRLTLGVSVFFLGMAVLDPLVQVGVQRLPWSTGLLIEVGFFVPAGLVLLVLSRRLRGASSASPASPASSAREAPAE